MKLRDYPRNEIEAALKIKGLNHVSLGKQLKRDTSAISKAIKGTLTFESKSLDSDILNALKPELEIIHDAFYGRDPLKGTMIADGIKMNIAGSHS